MKLSETQAAVLSLVQRFVDRQKIVRDAIKDLRPDLLIFAEHGELTDEQAEERFELHMRFRSSPHRFGGYWGKENEWRYRLHGLGCELIHRETQERIDWKAPRILKFDRYWLLDWIEWLTNQNTDDTSLSIVKSEISNREITLKEFIFAQLDELWHVGVLSEPDDQHTYTLLVTDGNSFQQPHDHQDQA